MGENTQNLLYIIPSISILISLAHLVFSMIRREFSTISKMIILILSGSLIYYIFSIVFASRMQSQHFVIMLFVCYLLLGLSLGELIKTSNETIRHSSIHRTTVVSVICTLSIFALICIGTQNTLSMKMKDDRRIHNQFYTQAIDKVAETALSNHEKSIDEYYIFPEWGLMCGFDYLTCNTIPFCDHFDETKIAKLHDSGFNIVVCYFDPANKNSYKQQLKIILNNTIEIKESVLQCWGDDLYLLTM